MRNILDNCTGFRILQMQQQQIREFFQYNKFPYKYDTKFSNRIRNAFYNIYIL